MRTERGRPVRRGMLETSLGDQKVKSKGLVSYCGSSEREKDGVWSGLESEVDMLPTEPGQSQIVSP